MHTIWSGKIIVSRPLSNPGVAGPKSIRYPHVDRLVPPQLISYLIHRCRQRGKGGPIPAQLATCDQHERTIVGIELLLECIEWAHCGLSSLGDRFGSGDGERKTLLTRQIAFEPLPASVLFALGGSVDVVMLAGLAVVWSQARPTGLPQG